MSTKRSWFLYFTGLSLKKGNKSPSLRFISFLLKMASVCLKLAVVFGQRMSYFWSQQQNTYITGPFHALQRFSLEMKVNVWFCVEAKEPSGPSVCREQERSVSQRRVSVWVNPCGFYLKPCRVLSPDLQDWMSCGVRAVFHCQCNKKTKLKSFITKCQNLIYFNNLAFKWSIYVFLWSLRGASQQIFTYEKQQPVNLKKVNGFKT